MFNDVQNGDMEPSSTSDDTNYDPADTNEDGTVSATEYTAYYGSSKSYNCF